MTAQQNPNIETEDEVLPEVAEAVEDVEVVEVVEEQQQISDEELIMTLDDVRLVEAMLFASASPLTEGQIAERFPPARAALIPDILEHLREQYANRGVNLVQRDKRFALRTATDLADQLRLEKEQPKKFTKAAMETMAVVAYHQPVTRAEIENIRGVATSPGALDALLEAGWIKPGKRREVPGRPVTWLSTQAFLDHFGLEKISDLPGIDDLKAAGLLDKRPAIEAMPTADLFDSEDARQDGEDPQEVTDEDLIGKPLVMEQDEDMQDMNDVNEAEDDSELDTDIDTDDQDEEGDDDASDDDTDELEDDDESEGDEDEDFDDEDDSDDDDDFDEDDDEDEESDDEDEEKDDL